MAAAEAAPGQVLHRAHRGDQVVAVDGRVVAQQRERVERPVQEPRPAGVGGDVGRREAAELLLEELDVVVAQQGGHAVRVARGVGGGAARVGGEEGQALAEGVVLELGGGGWEGVADGRRRGEERWDGAVVLACGRGFGLAFVVDEFLVRVALRAVLGLVLGLGCGGHVCCCALEGDFWTAFERFDAGSHLTLAEDAGGVVF